MSVDSERLKTRRYKTLILDDAEYRIRSVTALEWLQCVRAGKADGDDLDAAREIALCLVDDHGQPLYDWRDKAALREIAEWDSAVTLPIYFEIQKHCGTNYTIGSAVKNSGPTPTSAAPSA